MTDQYAFERDDGKDMTPAERASKQEETLGVAGVNLNVDLGALLVEDCQNYEDISDVEFSKRTASNLCLIYKRLFDLKKKQDADFGADGEILEYTKSRYTVTMPESKVVLPREKPAPVEKPKTKWEKFREERGMPAR